MYFDQDERPPWVSSEQMILSHCHSENLHNEQNVMSIKHLVVTRNVKEFVKRVQTESPSYNVGK